MSLQQGTQVAIAIDQDCDFLSDIYIWTDGDGDPNGLGGTGLPIDLTNYTAIQEFRTTQYVVASRSALRRTSISPRTGQ